MAIYTQALRDGYNLRLTITQSSQNIAANTSTISGRLEVHRPSGQADYTSYQTVWSTSINGVNASGTTAGYNFGSYSILTLRSWTQTITHNSDGTKSIGVAGAWRETDPDPQVGYTSAVDAGGTFTLTTIPRTSQISFTDNDVNAGVSTTINTNRASSSFTHTAKYSFGSLTNQTAGLSASSGITTSFTFTPPMSLLNQIPNSTSGTGTMSVTTMSGSTVIGTDTATFTVRAPSSVVPDFTTVTHNEAVSDVATKVGAYVQGLSKLNLTVTGEVGAYGSTISTRKIEVAGQTINADSGVTPNPISSSGTVGIKGTVTDSRGRSFNKTNNITVLPYTVPAISAVQFRRADVSGAPQPDGTYIRVDLTASTQSLINSTEKNTIAYTMYAKLRGTTSWGSPVAGPTSVGYTTSGGRLNFSGFITDGTYDIEDSWDVRVDISDQFATTSIVGTVATAAIDVHFDANLGVGVGKFRENGKLDVAGTVYSTGQNITGNTAQTGNITLTGDITVSSKLRLTSTGDASMSSTAHPLQLGADNGLNVIIDNNEMMARNNGATTSFGINGEGGDVNLGNSSSEINIPGHVDSPNLPWASAAGRVASASIAAGGATNVNVTFPAGRFSVAPNVIVGMVQGVRDVNAYAADVTSTGFVLVRGSTSTTTRTAEAHWFAVQMGASSASG